MNDGDASSSSSEVTISTVDATEEVLIRIPASVVHLIDKKTSMELAYGELEIGLLRQNEAAVAVLARVVGEQLQWPLTKELAVLKLDGSHYLFTLTSKGEAINYGLTIPSKGQEHLLAQLDSVLDRYTAFKEERVELEGEGEAGEWWVAAREVGPEEVERDEEKREKLEEGAAAYWTTLAPNVEEYSGSVARMIAAGSGMLVKGILWCGDVTVDRLRWGNQFLKQRLGTRESDAQVSPQCLRRISRVKSITKRSEDAATAILTGVIKVTDSITGSVVNSGVGKRFFNMIPGEIILASFDGFQKVCDAVELAGKNVLSTSSLVTTDLVTERYGEEAARATNEGLDAAGHVIGTAWTVFKLRKALNPKGALKPTSLAKAAAGKMKKAL